MSIFQKKTWKYFANLKVYLNSSVENRVRIYEIYKKTISPEVYSLMVDNDGRILWLNGVTYQLDMIPLFEQLQKCRLINLVWIIVSGTSRAYGKTFVEATIKFNGY
jgi:hypothetical protein